MSGVGKPGYKETAVGWIPREWQCLSFGDLLRTPPEYGANASAEDYKEGDIRYLRITDITEDSKLKSTGKKSLPRDVGEKYLLSDGDILLARSGSVGRSLVYRATYGLAAFAGYLLRFRLGSIATVEYVSQYFHSDAYWSWIGGAAKVGAQPNINAEQYKSLPLPVPPLPEQQKIAALLTAVDDKLDLIARQISATQTLKQGLMQTLFTRGVGTQRASDWPTVQLYEVAQVRTGVAKGKKGLKEPVTLPYLRVANVQDGHLDLREIKEIEVEASQVERYALKDGDMLMTEGGDFDKLGRGDVWKGQISPCLHQNHVFAVRPDPAKLNSYYLAAFAGSDQGRQYFLTCAKRTTNLASINSSQLKAFPILLPPIEIQEYIADSNDAVNAKLSALSAKQAHYQSLKRGLMQKLLSGEWRVKVNGNV